MTLVTPAPGAQFVADMEHALSTNCQLLSELGAALPIQVSSPVRMGSHAASMTVKPGQKRSELQGLVGGKVLEIKPGETHWFADSMYLKSGFPTSVPTSINGWQTVLQWKNLGGTQSTSPPVSVDIRAGRFTIYGGWGYPNNPRPYRLDLGPATTEKWNDFLFQIHFANAGSGWISAWFNNNQVVNQYKPPGGTTYPSPYAAYDAIRIGYYRDPKIATAGTIVHDEYRMGPSRDTVAILA